MIIQNKAERAPPKELGTTSSSGAKSQQLKQVHQVRANEMTLGNRLANETCASSSKSCSSWQRRKRRVISKKSSLLDEKESKNWSVNSVKVKAKLLHCKTRFVVKMIVVVMIIVITSTRNEQDNFGSGAPSVILGPLLTSLIPLTKPLVCLADGQTTTTAQTTTTTTTTFKKEEEESSTIASRKRRRRMKRSELEQETSFHPENKIPINIANEGAEFSSPAPQLVDVLKSAGSLNCTPSSEFPTSAGLQENERQELSHRQSLKFAPTRQEASIPSGVSSNFPWKPKKAADFQSLKLIGANNKSNNVTSISGGASVYNSKELGGDKISITSGGGSIKEEAPRFGQRPSSPSFLGLAQIKTSTKTTTTKTTSSDEKMTSDIGPVGGVDEKSVIIDGESFKRKLSVESKNSNPSDGNNKTTELSAGDRSTPAVEQLRTTTTTTTTTLDTSRKANPEEINNNSSSAKADTKTTLPGSYEKENALAAQLATPAALNGDMNFLITAQRKQKQHQRQPDNNIEKRVDVPELDRDREQEQEQGEDQEEQEEPEEGEEEDELAEEHYGNKANKLLSFKGGEVKAATETSTAAEDDYNDYGAYIVFDTSITNAIANTDRELKQQQQLRTTATSAAASSREPKETTGQPPFKVIFFAAMPPTKQEQQQKSRQLEASEISPIGSSGADKSGKEKPANGSRDATEVSGTGEKCLTTKKNCSSPGENIITATSTATKINSNKSSSSLMPSTQTTTTNVLVDNNTNGNNNNDVADNSDNDDDGDGEDDDQNADDDLFVIVEGDDDEITPSQFYQNNNKQRSSLEMVKGAVNVNGSGGLLPASSSSYHYYSKYSNNRLNLPAQQQQQQQQGALSETSSLSENKNSPDGRMGALAAERQAGAGSEASDGAGTEVSEGEAAEGPKSSARGPRAATRIVELDEDDVKWLNKMDEKRSSLDKLEGKGKGKGKGRKEEKEKEEGKEEEDEDHWARITTTTSSAQQDYRHDASDTANAHDNKQDRTMQSNYSNNDKKQQNPFVLLDRNSVESSSSSYPTTNDNQDDDDDLVVVVDDDDMIKNDDNSPPNSMGKQPAKFKTTSRSPSDYAAAAAAAKDWQQHEGLDNINGTRLLLTGSGSDEMSEKSGINLVPPDDSKHNIYYWRLIWVVLPLGATFGNLLVIMAVYNERSLQSVTNYFIVSLAFADLFVGIVVMPFAVYVLVSSLILEMKRKNLTDHVLSAIKIGILRVS